MKGFLEKKKMDFNAKKYVSFLILIFVGLFAEFVFFFVFNSYLIFVEREGMEDLSRDNFLNFR